MKCGGNVGVGQIFFWGGACFSIQVPTGNIFNSIVEDVCVGWLELESGFDQAQFQFKSAMRHAETNMMTMMMMMMMMM